MALDRKWEKFHGGPGVDKDGKQTIRRVTLSRSGMIYMNRRMHDDLGRPKAVSLYYSREDDAIGVQTAYERFAENFPVVKRQHGWGIQAAGFCRHFAIRVPTTQRFLRPDIDPEGVLNLNLRETVTVGGIVRRRRKEAAA